MESKTAVVRHFNRFITRQISVLNEGLLNSKHSPTEARLLFEIAIHQPFTASELSKELLIDMGYLSRLLSRLEKQGMIAKVQSETDGRQRLIELTHKGKEAFEWLNDRSEAEVSEWLGKLTEDEQKKLLASMKTIEDLLGDGEKERAPYVLRMHEPGDMGWITHRHGVLYAREYGWDESFEALVARIVSNFIQQFNPDKERCWIAELEGKIVGSVFLVQADDGAAKLRLLYVEPEARGMGVGSKLVEECIRFARRKGYSKLVLWTNSILIDARSIYKKAGFQLVGEDEHDSFGHHLTGETWELKL